jgi:cobalamin transport system substrate-binding protein
VIGRTCRSARWPCRNALLAVLALLVAAACGAPAAAPANTSTDCPPSSSDAPVELRHATNVSVREAGAYRVLTVAQPFPGGAP